MKTLFFAITFLSAITLTNAQALQAFEFTATLERTVTIGKAAPTVYAEPMNPKLISYKDNVLTITTISTGKEYSKEKVIRVIEFSKNNSMTYALEILDKDGIYNYLLYTVNKTLSGEESKSLLTPYIVKGRFIMEVTYLE